MSCRRPEGARSSQGFTLLELLITLSITAFGVLAMLLMQLQALEDGTRGRHHSGAAAVAQDQIERIEGMPFSDAGLAVMDPLVWASPPWLDNASDPTLAPGEIPVQVAQSGGTTRELVYEVWYLVGPDDPGDPNPDLRRVDLEVLWDDPDGGTSWPTRTGRPTVAVSTLLVDNDR